MESLNITENVTLNNATKPQIDDPQGLFVAYFSLFIMAIVPIYFGAQRSLDRLIYQKKMKEKDVDKISVKDALTFPLYASAALFGLYLVFKVLSKENINILLGAYFLLFGVLTLASCIDPLVDKYIPDFFVNHTYHISLTKEEMPPNSVEKTDSNSKEKINIFEFSYPKKHLIGLALSFCFTLWYILTKNWIANNLIAFAFSINALEYMQLNKVVTGCILLGGLFIYDIFWVFGTNVMVTVAKSFEAPIKVVFPRDIFVSGFSSNNLAMLGLGDIVIPGIFIALLLRFDHSKKEGSRMYFLAGYVAYMIGLFTTVAVMHVFKHAQPALLYLCPACLGIPIFLSLIVGDTGSLFKYEDHPEVEDKKEN